MDELHNLLCRIFNSLLITQIETRLQRFCNENLTLLEIPKVVET